ncbi:LysR family transcriptional regulator [Pseudomonas syringae CC1557]|uniref:LysR family transcriptional regulator n=1 Tax=Pseudomonas syringae CC1557 TaxID=1357279 RepID=W0MLH5_PSESX|nr:LysR family transcriptional regulator [Pseudomonas syringae]AHG39317.1 LysR family transcriptional regulator [Pseudomonas syringae CC1557]
MNLKALRCCVEVARQGSFTNAAQSLHIAQPALSMAVSRMEEELGVTLFNRAGRKITVTAEGQSFLARVQVALLELDMARQELRDMTQLQSGEIRVGVPPMFGLNYIPEVLSAFRIQHPGIVMTVLEGSADDISQRLEDRKIDIALLESRRVQSSWDSVLLGTDEMVLCMNKDNPLALEPFLEARHLQDEPMVVFDETFLQRHLLDAFCDAGSANYRIALQSNFVSLVIKATVDGMGISTLLRSVQERVSSIVGVPFKPAQTMSFSLCWRANEYLSFANKRFVDFVQTTDIFERESASGRSDSYGSILLKKSSVAFTAEKYAPEIEI